MRVLPASLLALALACGLAACAADAPPAPCVTRPGADPAINDRFKADEVDVASFVDLFETESREVARHRADLVAVLAPRPGERVADIGAGTGLFIEPFDKAVAPGGRLYAVDISAGLLEHIKTRILAEGLARTEPVLCDDRSTHLPADSVDAVFICDTYHHFEYPADTLRSIRRALRPGGRMVIVDFNRIEGVSDQWMLDHVRCDKQTVIAEVTAAGFALDEEVQVDGLVDNYVLRFIKR